MLTLCAGLGCVSERESGAPAPSAAPRPRSGAIEEINLLAIPVALNFDQNPGLDGFVIKVYAGNRNRPKPLLIEEGSIDVMMFDGIPGVTSGSSDKPLRVWNYTAKELEHFEIQSSIGIGYQLAPDWGEAKPAGNKISVVVRYTPPEGPAITSAPSIISAALK